jgi:hypothetical protein
MCKQVHGTHFWKNHWGERKGSTKLETAWRNNSYSKWLNGFHGIRVIALLRAIHKRESCLRSCMLPAARSCLLPWEVALLRAQLVNQLELFVSQY